jgi:hypothetical protein
MKTKGLHFARANFRLITKAQDAAIRLSAGPGRAKLPVREPLFGDLVLTFFNDLKPIYPAITEGELDEYGMSREDLRQIAWNNLYLAFRQLKIMTTSQSELFVVEGAGDMIACMALHDRQWDTLEKQYGSLVVAFARRDLVLFATASNKAAIAALREAAAKVDSGDPKSLSRQLYQRRANGWQAL